MSFDKQGIFYKKILHSLVVIKVSLSMAINTLTFKACFNGWGKLYLRRM